MASFTSKSSIHVRVAQSSARCCTRIAGSARAPSAPTWLRTELVHLPTNALGSVRHVFLFHLLWCGLLDSTGSRGSFYGSAGKWQGRAAICRPSSAQLANVCKCYIHKWQNGVQESRYLMWNSNQGIFYFFSYFGVSLPRSPSIPTVPHVWCKLQKEGNICLKVSIN